MKPKFTDYLFIAAFILAYVAVVLVVWDSLQPMNLLCSLSFGAAVLGGGCLILATCFLE
jgi:hypothetical protein